MQRNKRVDILYSNIPAPWEGAGINKILQKRSSGAISEALFVGTGTITAGYRYIQQAEIDTQLCAVVDGLGD